MPAPETAQQHYTSQQRLAALTVLLTRRQWSRLRAGDLEAGWRITGPRLLAVLVAAQRAAAAAGARYVDQAVAELNLPDDVAGQVEPSAFAGEASDGRPLDTLLEQPLRTTADSMRAGDQADVALLAGRDQLDLIVRTQVADAGRGAAGVAIAAHPGVTGWVRMLELPSCDRCVVLAGKLFRWNDGFLRHPRCDCRHIPASEDLAGDLRTDPRAAVAAGQVRGLSVADTRAIVVDGADVAQVINAKRGMYTADVGGRTVSATRAAARRSLRLRPEQIYREAGDDRAEAIRLLARSGYLTT